MESNFHFVNLNCCSLELHWNYTKKVDKKDSLDSYELYQREGENHFLTNYWSLKLFIKVKIQIKRQ